MSLGEWENSNSKIIQKAREAILEANAGVRPVVLDPFSGGGSIPLKALRLGCETYANDYNPVAVLLLKCVLEYPQKFSGAEEDGKKQTGVLSPEKKANQLLADVKKWSEGISKSAESEIGHFYPSDSQIELAILTYLFFFLVNVTFQLTLFARGDTLGSV